LPRASNKGGSRQGAGAPTLPPALSLVPTDKRLSSDLDALRIQLTPQQAMAANMLARGFTNTKVAEQLGLHRQSISNWKDIPAFNALVDKLNESLLANPYQGLDPLVPKAFNRLDEALEGDDLRLATSVAESVLDRRYGKAVVRQVSLDSKEFHFYFNDKPDGLTEDAWKQKYVEADYTVVE
jgi:hypothetical protein